MALQKNANPMWGPCYKRGDNGVQQWSILTQQHEHFHTMRSRNIQPLPDFSAYTSEAGVLECFDLAVLRF